MIRRGPFLLPLVPALLLAGCATPAPKPATAPPPVAQKPAKIHEAGLERVMGKTKAQLVALFGDADLDGHEGQAQRLQFVGPACVLDAYLYPAKAGSEPVVTYVDARTPAGEDMDRASCIASLSRRAAAP
ncbi:hypothetical protein [Sphingomonas sp. PR090111-T3T-6A]|uniref:hypothetical protein n=1 Tax=Sphingomonas sp. PR090111-T3T-6A TaxID=685778 RepID=UPI000380F680|nr:hypothetical protein [Sphingomonas sp. PR090111-T3T-6A]